jgi:RND family efflux transporter MFP subunit
MPARIPEEKPMTMNIVPASIVLVRRGGDRFLAVMAATSVIVIAVSVAGCSKKEARTPEPRPVRTVTVESQADGETLSFTGQIRARDQFNLAFRLDGRVIERHAGVGDLIAAGQVVARLDSQNQQNALRSAEANLVSAQATLTRARLAFGRQQELMKNGWTPRARFDDAQQAFRTAEAQVDSAQAQLLTAQDQLSYTVLRGDRGGAVTAVGAEPGEVVKAGQTIVQLAGQGKLDAVFDVPEHLVRTGPRDPLVELALSEDPQVQATGICARWLPKPILRPAPSRSRSASTIPQRA